MHYLERVCVVAGITGEREVGGSGLFLSFFLSLLCICQPLSSLPSPHPTSDPLDRTEATELREEGQLRSW